MFSFKMRKIDELFTSLIKKKNMKLSKKIRNKLKASYIQRK